jgi:hypothetical protein
MTVTTILIINIFTIFVNLIWLLLNICNFKIVKQMSNMTARHLDEALKLREQLIKENIKNEK